MLPKGLLKEYSRTISMMVRAMDMICILVAGWLAYIVKFHDYVLSSSYTSVLLLGAIVTSFVFYSFNIYASIRGESFLKHIATLVQGVTVMALLLAGLSFFTKSGAEFSRAWFLLWIGFASALLILCRCSLLYILRFMRSKGLNERRVVIFGTGELSLKFAQKIQHSLWTGFRIVAFIDDQPPHTSPIPTIPVMKTPEHLGQFLSEKHIDEIWIAQPLGAEERVKQVLHELRLQTITTRFVLDIFGLDLLNHSLTELAGFPVLNICSTPMMGFNRLIKALEDRILAAIILLLISPIFLPIAIAVKLSSPGPIFYRQKRIGWNGNEFEMLKFRTMPVNAESKTGPVWATKDDQRPTRIGKFLRQTSLDELPQFINVIKGDMSIVGPRPERKVFVDDFKEKIPRYMQKHLMKAGITGWAQIHGWRGNTSLEKRIEYDLYYIEHWSLFLDLKIIFLTIFHGFVNRNAY